MSEGPILIFDKSALESLSLDEAVLLDNFYMSNITPLFFVECLADLERQMHRMRSTPEELVGSLASRTPDFQSCANVHHKTILMTELMGQFDLRNVRNRPCPAGGQPVQLGNSAGIIFRSSEEEEALRRWKKREFLDLERQIAKGWRRMISRIDLYGMSKAVLSELGPWRKPKSLEDARQMVDIILNNMDPEWILSLGLSIFGIPETADAVVRDWIDNRRKPLSEYRPYFVFMLSINIFFCLVLPTELLKNVKQSHQIDLAYLYYLPFCSVFTSRDNFHVQVAPLFMSADQSFVHGDDLKADLRMLNEHYSNLSQEELDKGLYNFAKNPPDDRAYLTTRLWDKHFPRGMKRSPNVKPPPEIEKSLVELVMKSSNESIPRDKDLPFDQVNYVTVQKQVLPKKGKYLRFSRDAIEKLHEAETG